MPVGQARDAAATIEILVDWLMAGEVQAVDYSARMAFVRHLCPCMRHKVVHAEALLAWVVAALVEGAGPAYALPLMMVAVVSLS
jgi:hypothetical protein